MIGYHYTSYKNWLKIKKQGLIPYKIDRTEFTELFHRPVFGIWVWKNRMKGLANLGTLLDRAITKKTPHVVLLKVQFDKKDYMQELELKHNGTLQDWDYHKNQESFLVIIKIPPERIWLLGDYDFLKYTLDNETKSSYS